MEIQLQIKDVNPHSKSPRWRVHYYNYEEEERLKIKNIYCHDKKHEICLPCVKETIQFTDIYKYKDINMWGACKKYKIRVNQIISTIYC